MSDGDTDEFEFMLCLVRQVVRKPLSVSFFVTDVPDREPRCSPDGDFEFDNVRALASELEQYGTADGLQVLAVGGRDPERTLELFSAALKRAKLPDLAGFSVVIVGPAAQQLDAWADARAVIEAKRGLLLLSPPGWVCR